MSCADLSSCVGGVPQLCASVICGDNWFLTVTWQDPDGNPVDLTTATILATFKDKIGGTQIVQISLGSGITVADPTSGVIDLELTSAQTSLFCPDYVTGAVWDLEVTHQDGTVETVLGGPVQVERTVTE